MTITAVKAAGFTATLIKLCPRGDRLPAVTSVTAAVLAASCCLVQLALIAVGVTGWD